jgi:hypothetical protein
LYSAEAVWIPFASVVREELPRLVLSEVEG